MAVSKAKSPAKKSSHPKYNEMIVAAIKALKEKGGSSRLAILKYISGKYNVSDNPNAVNSKLKLALKRGVVSGTLSQVKGTGASGSFKLSAAAKTKETVKVLKPKATKSPKKVVKPKADSKNLTKKAATKKPKSPKKVKPKADSKKLTKKAATKLKSPKKSPKKPAMKAAKLKVKKATKPTKK